MSSTQIVNTIDEVYLNCELINLILAGYENCSY